MENPCEIQRKYYLTALKRIFERTLITGREYAYFVCENPLIGRYRGIITSGTVSRVRPKPCWGRSRPVAAVHTHPTVELWIEDVELDEDDIEFILQNNLEYGCVLAPTKEGYPGLYCWGPKVGECRMPLKELEEIQKRYLKE